MKKTWKKWVALGMTFGMMAGIAGCGSSKNDRTVYFRRNVKISY